jgi:4-hydroxy-tetrahydrodipicolinate synthase
LLIQIILAQTRVERCTEDPVAADFHGIYPMLYAFFDAEGRLDRDAFLRQVEACIARGAHGIAVLGLATEVSKLSAAERRQAVEWVADAVKGRVPLAVTIFGATPQEQIDAVRHAAGQGAAWVALQPPPDKTIGEAALMRFFGAVMDGAPIPVGIQNAPAYIGTGLSPENIVALHRAHANFTVLKLEGPATMVAQVAAAAAGKLRIFNGRGGLELPDNLRAGCAGMIPAPDGFDRLVDGYEAMRRGDEAAAERSYAEILPAAVFVMQSIDHLLCYGKRLAAARLGLGPVHDRAPFLAPTAFGLGAVARFARSLGPIGAR